MMRISFMFTILALTACGEQRAVFQDQQCTIQDNRVICPDGTEVLIPQHGINGRDGKDGTQIRVVDPCGDGPGHDEIILMFDDGTIMAWYKNLGLTVLEENRPYMTTDAQKCQFYIYNGEVEEL